jgi:hypothetical protein
MRDQIFGAFFLVSVIGAVACTGDDDVPLADAGDHDAGGDGGGVVDPACDPVAQSGCGPGQKCTYVIDEAGPPQLSRTQCADDGTVAIDGACGLQSETVPIFDNCVAGAYCIDDVCKKICSNAPNSCDDGFVCSTYVDTFEDFPDVGVCVPGCDPVSQNCVVEEEGCYTQIAAVSGSCGGVPDEAAQLTQDDICFGEQAGECFLNGCAQGFGGLLPLNPAAMDIDHCAAFCTPNNTSTDTVNHPGPSEGTSSGEGYGACSDRGALAHECRFLNSFYGGAEITPDSVGFCVPTDVWGDCDTMDPQTQMDANGTVVFGCISTNFEAPAFKESEAAKLRMKLPEGFVMPLLPH